MRFWLLLPAFFCLITTYSQNKSFSLDIGLAKRFYPLTLASKNMSVLNKPSFDVTHYKSFNLSIDVAKILLKNKLGIELSSYFRFGHSHYQREVDLQNLTEIKKAQEFKKVKIFGRVKNNLNGSTNINYPITLNTPRFYQTMVKEGEFELLVDYIEPTASLLSFSFPSHSEYLKIDSTSKENPQNSYGLKAGLNYFLTPGLYIPEYILTHYLGVYSEIKIGRAFYFLPEIQYSQKGSRFPEFGIYPKGRISLHYLTLPLLFGIKPVKGLTISLGPEVGILLKSLVKYKDFIPLNETRGYSKFDFSLAGNVTCFISEIIGFDIRYIYGLNGLVKIGYDNGSGNIDYRPEGRNEGIQFGCKINMARIL